jgi:recombinational DNA repair protein (RecF pathway)
MAIEKTEAVVLRTIKFGETSKILTLLTRDFGLLKAIAKGVRGARPKFGAALDPFARSEIVVYRRRERELHLVGGADLVEAHLPLASHLARYAFASAVVEFVPRVVSGELGGAEGVGGGVFGGAPGGASGGVVAGASGGGSAGEPAGASTGASAGVSAGASAEAPAGEPVSESARVYAEAARVLALMTTAPIETLPYLLRAFQLRFVTLLGHGMELHACLGCGRPVGADGGRGIGAADAGRLVLSASQGGLFCPSCASEEADGMMPVTPAALAVLRAYLEQDLDVALRQRLAPAVRAETGRIIETFLGAQFEHYRGLRSLKLAAAALG